ncbi:MAG: hypothetical protein JSR24_21380 [Proteobacteria bacterium]|nr:hypothetical protein [Pseudomonadota bacterium]
MQLDFDLVNRVRNVSLAESPSNALLPVYEAISNAIHAIEARFRAVGIGKGQIRIEIEVDRKQRVPRVIVSDNGVGLNVENWNSFRTSDSPHKLKRGGKGVGRLSWLKVFQFAEIESVYAVDGEFERVRFELHLTNDSPIKRLRKERVIAPHRGTTVTLHSMADAFTSALPKKSDTVARRIAGHFLPYLIGEDRPRITLEMGDDAVEVDGLVTDAIRKTRKQTISVDISDQKVDLEITHLVLHRSLRFSAKDHNWAFYGGNKRVVDQRPLDSQLGLRAIGPSKDCFYIAYVTGAVFDKTVNAERTGFTIEVEVFQRIHNAVRDAAKRFLRNEIEGVRAQQKETVQRLIEEHPTLRIFDSEVDDFVNQKLSLNTRDAESVYLELQRYNLRRTAALKRDVATVESGKGGVKAASISTIRKMTENLEVRAENALAEYVRWRHKVLSILSEKIGQVDLATGKYSSEQDVHQLIVPLRVMSSSVAVEDRNAWIIDDRIPHYGFVASDKRLQTIYKHLKSARRPDLLFDQVFGFRSVASSEPVILVEFKKPGRTQYSKSDNPVTQLVDYVVELRQGKTTLVDGKGVQIPTVGSGAWFQAYVIADLMPTLREIIDNHTFANTPTHDGNGRLGIHQQHKLVVQVLSYGVLLQQALQRNKVLFDKLGLTEIT